MSHLVEHPRFTSALRPSAFGTVQAKLYLRILAELRANRGSGAYHDRMRLRSPSSSLVWDLALSVAPVSALLGVFAGLHVARALGEAWGWPRWAATAHDAIRFCGVVDPPVWGALVMSGLAGVLLGLLPGVGVGLVVAQRGCHRPHLWAITTAMMPPCAYAVAWASTWHAVRHPPEAWLFHVLGWALGCGSIVAVYWGSWSRAMGATSAHQERS